MATKSRATRNPRVKRQTKSLADRLVEAKTQPEAKVEVKAEIVAKRITFPMAMVIKRWSSQNGHEFKFEDKLGTNSYSVSVNGIVLTPAEASTLVGIAKSGK